MKCAEVYLIKCTCTADHPAGNVAQDAANAHVYAVPDYAAADSARTEIPRYGVFNDSPTPAPGQASTTTAEHGAEPTGMPQYAVINDAAPQALAPVPTTADRTQNLALYEYSEVDTPDGQTYAIPSDTVHNESSLYSSP